MKSKIFLSLTLFQNSKTIIFIDLFYTVAYKKIKSYLAIISSRERSFAHTFISSS